MNQFRIVADSSCDLLALNGADFISVPLTIRTDTEEFCDDASLDVDAMVSVLRNTRGRSYSACPNIADWEKAFGERGDVIAFTITSALSGSYNAACVAKKNCEEHDPSRRIHVVDSLSTGPEIALLIEKAVSELHSGADVDDACRAVQAYKGRTHLLFALESMHNLAQNGRISKLAATMAGVLGRLGYKGGSVRIGHCQNAALALELCNEIQLRFSAADVKSYPLRGLCSYYAERGGIILGFES